MSEVDSVPVNNASGDENTQVCISDVILRCILIGKHLKQCARNVR